MNKHSNSKHKAVTKTWISGHNSCTLVIPKNIAKEYGVNTPSYIVVEAKPEGILIRKIEV